MPVRHIIVEDYNPAWAEWFRQIETALRPILSVHHQSIEHVGSTSVPNLAAKPIIDVDIVIRREIFPKIVELLDRYGFRHNGDQGIFDREAFNAKTDAIAGLFPPMHLYVCPDNSLELYRHLTFRDYLRQSPEDVIRYGKVKKDCAEKCPHDIDDYVDCKDSVVKAILQKALEYRKKM